MFYAEAVKQTGPLILHPLPHPFGRLMRKDFAVLTQLFQAANPIKKQHPIVSNENDKESVMKWLLELQLMRGPPDLWTPLNEASILGYHRNPRMG